MTNENCPKYLDCGKVISKSNDEVIIKRGSKTNLYLNVQFKQSGFISVESNQTTYFSHNVGDNVCFYLNKHMPQSHYIIWITGLICSYLIVGLSFIGLGHYIITD
jgi:hypothetical protein